MQMMHTRRLLMERLKDSTTSPEEKARISQELRASFITGVEKLKKATSKVMSTIGSSKESDVEVWVEALCTMKVCASPSVYVNRTLTLRVVDLGGADVLGLVADDMAVPLVLQDGFITFFEGAAGVIGTPWPDATIQLRISAEARREARFAALLPVLRAGMGMVNNIHVITIIEVADDYAGDCLVLVPPDDPATDWDCKCTVGKHARGLNKIWLWGNRANNANITAGIVAHELLHAAGLVHTHQRLDRDTYVTYEGPRNAWGFEPFGEGVGPYDFPSVMHYQFGEYGDPPNIVLGIREDQRAGLLAAGIVVGQVGQRNGTSRGDANGLQWLYPYAGVIVPAGFRPYVWEWQDDSILNLLGGGWTPIGHGQVDGEDLFQRIVEGARTRGDGQVVLTVMRLIDHRRQTYTWNLQAMRQTNDHSHWGRAIRRRPL